MHELRTQFAWAVHTWTKLHDSFLTSDRLNSVGCHARILFVSSIVWSNKNQKQGLVEQRKLRQIYLPAPGERFPYKRATEELLRAGLFERLDANTFRINGFTSQSTPEPSAEVVP